MINEAEYIKQLPKKRIAAGVLLQKNNKFLIVKPSYRDYWEIPGGIVELGESPLQASIREVKEEVGLDIQIHKLALVDFKSDENLKQDAIHFIFLASPIDDTQKIKLQDKEIIDFKYADTEEAISLLGSHVAKRVQCIIESKSSETIYSEYGENTFG